MSLCHSSYVTDSDGSLPDALDRLYDAVGALCDPRKELHDGALMAAPSLWEELLDAIPARKGDGFTRGVSRSKAPAWCEAIDLQQEVDLQVRRWQPEGTSTPDRLRGFASRRWRPQDARMLTERAEVIRGWCVSIKGMLEPAHVKTISAACPSCDTAVVYRKVAGESVRQPALQVVAELGCTCLACGASWAPESYLWLCRLLGFDLPAGVLV